jgi:lincosamide nucleotidyltransferase A/C/D/E
VFDPKAVAAERVRRFIKRHSNLMKGAESLWRAVDSVPAPVGNVLQSVKRRLVRETGWAELVLVMDSLESRGIPYWLAGGWGIDALVGRSTRRHRDIDVVIENFEVNEPNVRKAFVELGFCHVNMDRGGAWMPSRSNFEDVAGHRIELLAIDWGYIRDVFELDPKHGPKSDGTADDVAGEIYTTGSLNERRVPCLTVGAQLLFHTGFPLESAGQLDVALLHDEFG